MVITDFNIICLGQKEKTPYNSDTLTSDCYYPNRKKIYAGWLVTQYLKGVWYQIYPIARNTFDYQKELFDLITCDNYDNIDIPDFLKGNLRQDTYNIKVIGETNEIIDIINFYIQRSPIKTIAVLFRLQGKEKETLMGLMNREDFYTNLASQKLLFNVVYLVTEKLISQTVKIKDINEIIDAILSGKLAPTTYELILNNNFLDEYDGYVEEHKLEELIQLASYNEPIKKIITLIMQSIYPRAITDKISRLLMYLLDTNEI